MLSQVSLEELEAASKRWRSQRHPKAPLADELLSLIWQRRHEKHKPKEPWQELDDTGPKPPIDAVYAELAREHPDNAVLRQRITERQRAHALTPSVPSDKEDSP
jgi:hypothetical protein